MPPSSSTSLSTYSGNAPANSNAIAGTAMAVFFSLANGLGRIGWGTISDKIGRKSSIIIMTGVQGAMMLLFPLMAGTRSLLYLGATMASVVTLGFVQQLSWGYVFAAVGFGQLELVFV